MCLFDQCGVVVSSSSEPRLLNPCIDLRTRELRLKYGFRPSFCGHNCRSFIPTSFRQSHGANKRTGYLPMSTKADNMAIRKDRRVDGQLNKGGTYKVNTTPRLLPFCIDFPSVISIRTSFHFNQRQRYVLHSFGTSRIITTCPPSQSAPPGGALDTTIGEHGKPELRKGSVGPGSLGLPWIGSRSRFVMSAGAGKHPRLTAAQPGVAPDLVLVENVARWVDGF